MNSPETESTPEFEIQASSTTPNLFRKHWISLLIILFVVFSGSIFFLLVPWTSSETPQIVHTPTLPELPYDYEVTYTSSGYAPNILEVPIGSRVAFKNTTNIPMWTASDPHPVHGDFSPFDARRGYGNGETYIFRFESSGTYGFHNHEKSLHRGVVRVFDSANPKPNIDKTKEGKRAKRDELLAMFDQNDPDSIFRLIDRIEADNAISRDCHDMAHDLGHRAYEVFGFSTAMTFSNPNHAIHTSSDDICAGGYMHGILEELFLNHPELKDNPEGVCSGIPEIHRGSCYHGVGHGLMFVHERDVPASLLSCRGLSQPKDMYRCFEGVWMEMFWGNTDHAGANSLGWTIGKPLEACKNAQIDEKPTCFLYAHLGYLRSHPRDYSGVIKFCTQSKLSTADEHFCIKGIGITMMKRFTSHRLTEAEKLVNSLGYADRLAYYDGIISYSLLSGVSRGELTTFCGKLVNDGRACRVALKGAE